MSRRVTRCVVLVVTARPGAVAWTGTAAPGRAALTGCAIAAGAPIWGNRGSGVEIAGSATGGAGMSIPALIEATAIERYGSPRAISPATPNQNRWRRVPRPDRPNARGLPALVAPA